MVEAFATQHGILFFPKPGNKMFEGKAIWLFGNVDCYFEHNVVFASLRSPTNSKSHIWQPIGLEELVEICK